MPLFPISLIRDNGRVYIPFFLRCLGSSAVWAVFPLFLVRHRHQQALGGPPGCDQHGIAVRVHALRGTLQTAPWVLASGSGNLGDRLCLLRVWLPTTGNSIPFQILLAVSWSCLWVGSLSFLLGRSVERGTAAGLLYSMTYLSAGFGPLIGGFVSETWGFRALMFVASGLTFLGLILSWVLPANKQVAHL